MMDSSDAICPTVKVCAIGGLGDDLMFFWATVAGVLSGVLPKKVIIYFQSDITRNYLIEELAEIFPEITMLRDEPTIDSFLTISRSFIPIKMYIKNLLFFKDNPRYCNFFIHMQMNDYGATFRLRVIDRLLVKLKIFRIYTAHFNQAYIGWQEAALVFKLTREQMLQRQGELSRFWAVIKKRLPQAAPLEKYLPPLFFPGGKSFQDFDCQFVSWIKEAVPSVQVVRHISDRRAADITYDSLQSLQRLMTAAKFVITNDSSPSHLAQFFARKHILICTRSNPVNVCFPGAANTTVFDLGIDLKCRPCVYRVQSADGGARCPAGFGHCKGQDDELLIKKMLKNFCE